MAANDFDYAQGYVQGGDVPATNKTGSDIAANTVVKLDATNPESGAVPCACITTAGSGDYPEGITIEAIPNTKTGRVRRLGEAVVIADSAITAGDVVQAGTTGQVRTKGAGVPQLGQAKTAAAASGDKIRILIDIAKNA